MRKFLLGFIMMIFCFSVVAQEDKENNEISFSEQTAFQKIIHQDGFFSVNKFQFSDGTKIKNRKELNAALYNIPEAKKTFKKSQFLAWHDMAFNSWCSWIFCGFCLC